MIAQEGGKPVRSTRLSYGRQTIDDADIQAVVDCLKSDYLTTGPAVEGFESDLAQYTGTKYAVVFNSGTAALHAACFAAGVKVDDEVITTPITFAASANAVLYCGGKPVFCDIDLATYLIDPAFLSHKITPKTKAIIPVDFMGEVADMDSIMTLAKEQGLVVIEDASHSIGSSFKGRKVGCLADMTVFSFHPVKTITTGEGGAVVTDNRVFFEKLKLFRTHGITRLPDYLHNSALPSWYYEQQALGFNYRMTDIQAALGRSQLKKIEGFIKRRQAIVGAYNSAFSELAGVILPKTADIMETCRHLYVLRIDEGVLKVDRDTIFKALEAENIGVNLHYIPVYRHPYYQSLGYSESECPSAEIYYRTAFTIPLFSGMSDSDVKDVIDGVFKVIEYYRENQNGTV